MIATGTVYVIVKQRDNGEEIYRGTLAADQTVPLAKQGPVDILFTAGENLVIESQGERMRPSTSGTAKITIPYPRASAQNKIGDGLRDPPGFHPLPDRRRVRVRIQLTVMLSDSRLQSQ